MRRAAASGAILFAACAIAPTARAADHGSESDADAPDVFPLPRGPYGGPPIVEADDVREPGRAALRWQNQIRESFIEASPLWITRTNGGGGVTHEGADIGIGFGATPNLKLWRLGGAYGFRARSLDDKTYLLGTYSELTCGLRFGATEIYSFAGVTWLTAGASHSHIAIGGLSPRAGFSAGLTLGFIALHAYVAAEYNFGFTGFDDYRATLVGVRLSLLSMGY